tara:strand:- start:426 stop:1586 length:1161 start_codon:yes stop_codon:yes gene_type:complete
MTKYFTNHPIFSSVIAAGIVALVGFVVTQIQQSKVNENLVKSAFEEIMFRAAAAESLLRLECSDPNNRLSEAYHHISNPKNSKIYSREEWISTPPEHSLTSTLELLKFVEKHYDSLGFHADTDREFFIRTPRKLVQLLDRFHPSRYSSLTSNKMHDNNLENEALSFRDQLFEMFKPIYGNSSFENQDGNNIRSLNSIGRGNEFFEARIHGLLSSFDSTNDAYWWGQCINKAAKCVLTYERASKGFKDDLSFSKGGYEAKYIMLWGFMREQASSELKYAEKEIRKLLATEAYNTHKDITAIRDKSKNFNSDLNSTYIKGKVIECDTFFQAVYPGVIEFIESDYGTLTEADRKTLFNKDTGVASSLEKVFEDFSEYSSQYEQLSIKNN